MDEQPTKANSALPLTSKNDRRACPDKEIEYCRGTLACTYNHCEHFPQRPLAKLFERIAARIDGALCFDPDALLGMMQLSSPTPNYAIHHSLHKAVFAGYIAALAGEPRPTRIEVIAAGLSANLSMARLQSALDRQDDPLSSGQLRQILAHPANGAAALRWSDEDIPPWLRAVGDHHERPDGRGYPCGLSNSRIADTAKFVRMADTFTALTSERGYRNAIPASAAFREMYYDAGGFDTELLHLVVSEIAPCPPGSVVELSKTGEIALVLRRGPNALSPIAAPVPRLAGSRSWRPSPRVIALRDISRVLPSHALPEVSGALLWGYQN